jgi:GNAT superfamily N-acetyltransferase
MSDRAASTVVVRALEEQDRQWAAPRLAEAWAAPIVISRGRVHRPADLPGFVALRGEERVGLVTYATHGGQCEVVTLNSWLEGVGVGTALLDAVRRAAAEAGCRRVWLITTNDNLRALGFYQKRGFRLVAVYAGAVDEARERKPQIPVIGAHGIPLRDEIELELVL